MDFQTVLYTSGSLTAIILTITLIIYGARIRRVVSEVTDATRMALYSFGASGVMTVIVTVAGLFYRGLFMAWMGLFFEFLISTMMYILYPEGSRGKYARIGIFAIALGMLAENLISFLGIIPDFGIRIAMMGLTIYLVAAFLFAFILVRETPSAFTGSIMLILILYVITAITAGTYFIFDHTEYFIIQSLPILVSAAVFGSVNRPWRTMVTLFIVFTAIAMSGGLLLGALMTNPIEWTTVLFVVPAIIASLSLVAPMNYFIEQAVNTGNRTPQFISVVLATVSILALTHSNSFAIYMSATPHTWNEFFVWSDVILGSVAIIAFLIAGASASFSEGAYIVTRELGVMFGTAMIVLGFPVIRGWPGENVWRAAELYPFLAVAMAIGIILFVRTSYRLHRSGATRAAQNLMTFVVAALIIGIVTMFSDQLNIFLVMLLLIIASGLALASSPPIIARFRAVVRRLDEVSTLGEDEDGTIRF